ncbi:MAG: hypothetical protein QOD63_2206 [Actinomycetota bacterium]|jgi:hypothetical protein|nr:hypothetical protein [Actinomycetota bacterium]
MTFDLAGFLAAKRPNTATCPIALDSDVVQAHVEAQAAVDVARAVVEANSNSVSRSALAEAEEALEAAVAASEAATQVFAFVGLDGPSWDALVDAHPPTPEQIRRAKKLDQPKPNWDEDTFPAALIAACSSDPELTAEEAQELLAAPNMNAAETGGLFIAAHSASRTRRIPQLGKGSGSTRS